MVEEDAADDPADESSRAEEEPPAAPTGGEGSETADTEDAGAPAEDEAIEASEPDRTEPEEPRQDETEAEQDSTSAEEPRPRERHVPEDVQKYARFQKVDGGTYRRVNEFLRDRTYITAREWAISRLCADFRTETGVEMTKIGDHLPELVPFMTDTYSPQAVNQARHAFETKVRKSGATFLYGAMSDFFTAEELDDVMYECTEVAKFLLEVEGVELSVDEEIEAEDRISSVMREVRRASEELRHEDVECPECGHHFGATTHAEES